MNSGRYAYVDCWNVFGEILFRFIYEPRQLCWIKQFDRSTDVPHITINAVLAEVAEQAACLAETGVVDQVSYHALPIVSAVKEQEI